MITPEAVLEFGPQTSLKQRQSREIFNVLAKVCSPKALVVHMPLADYLPRRFHPDPQCWEPWEHECSIASFASSLRHSLEHISVHNIVSQKMWPQLPTAKNHFHFAQYPFVEPKRSQELDHYGTPPLCKFDRHCQIIAPLLGLIERFEDEASDFSTGTGPLEHSEVPQKPLGSCTFYNAEAMLFSTPEDGWTVEKAVRSMVDTELGDECLPDLREKIQAQIHFVAGDPTW